MKKTLVFLLPIFLLISCDVYYVEPVVPYDPRDAFVGTYDINEYSSTYDEYWEYGVSINKSAGDIVIDNFYNSGLRVYANVNGTRLYIPWQTIDGYEVQGDGFVEGNKITLNYKIRDSYTSASPWDFCTASGWLY